MRRVFFVTFALLLYRAPALQLTFFVLQAVFALGFLGVTRPFVIEIDNLVEGVSEIIIVLYGLSKSRLFKENTFKERVDHGHFSIGLLCFLIAVNFARWVYGIYLVI